MTTYAAPAKVNLSLRILGKRDDGFHEVDLLMARLDLADELEIDKSRSLSLLCDAPGVPTDDSNLAMKAVREFEGVYGRAVKKKITLRKRVPHGAGLGGGSSDAATTLLALNAELGTGFDLTELSAMAARIGSDVPFFLNPVLSRCTGRGEIVAPVAGHATWSSPIVLLKPTFGIATAEAYSGIHYARRMKGLPYGTQKVDGIELVNDLERPVFAKFPFLGIIKSWLLRQNGVRAAMMSGSGSTIFALTHTLEQAKIIAEAARTELDPTLYTYCGTVNPPLPDDSLYAPYARTAEHVQTDAPALSSPAETDNAAGIGDSAANGADSSPAAASDNLVFSPEQHDSPAPQVPQTPEPVESETPSPRLQPVPPRVCSAAAPEDKAPGAPRSQECGPKHKASALRSGGPGSKRKGRKPAAIIEAEKTVAAARQEVEELNRRIAATKEALLADGLDPDVKRRGRKPTRLVEYGALLEAEIEARRKQQAAEYNLAKMEYELT